MHDTEQQQLQIRPFLRDGGRNGNISIFSNHSLISLSHDLYHLKNLACHMLFGGKPSSIIIFMFISSSWKAQNSNFKDKTLLGTQRTKTPNYGLQQQQIQFGSKTKQLHNEIQKEPWLPPNNCSRKSGFEVCKTRGILQDERLYSNSLQAINILLRETNLDHPLKAGIDETRDLSYSHWDVKIISAHRETIYSADFMAREVHDEIFNMILVPDMPSLRLRHF